MATIGGTALSTKVSTILDASSWDEILATSPSDGDVAIFMDLTWKYDGTNSMWVPSWMHGETLSEKLVIVGNEADDAALITNGWTVTESGGGVIEYDGTRVRFNCAGTNSKIAYVNASHSGSSTDTYMAYGRLRLDSYVGTVTNWGCVIYVVNGVRKMGINLNYPAVWHNNNITGDYQSDSTAFSTEHFFLVHMRTQQVNNPCIQIWIEGSSNTPAATCTYPVFLEANTLWGIGDLSSGGSSDLYVRDFVIARY